MVQTLRIDKAITYSVVLIDEGKASFFLETIIRWSIKFSQQLAAELEVDIPNMSRGNMEKKQDDEIKEKETRYSIQPRTLARWTWFRRPYSYEGSYTKTQRFQDMSGAEVDDLQDSSKSENTHKHAIWAVKIYKGKENSYFLPKEFFNRVFIIYLIKLK